MNSLRRRLKRRLFKEVRLRVMKMRRMFLFMRRRVGEMERKTRAK
jgi:hypothetical protein